MNAHILLVEDDPLLRIAVKEILTIKGCIISEADTRVSAMEILHANPSISVVLLDLGLPPSEHNISEGIATLEAIQSEFLKVKVIVLTGMYHENASLEAIRGGAFDFLPKPASPMVIMSAIDRALLFLQKEHSLLEEGITRISFNAQLNDGLKSVRREAEKYVVLHTLKETGFNIYQSAKKLSIKRENMYYFLKKYGIERDNLE